tara:strand:- start:1977 stop:2651 length:675 start_codon:yes stop_codon:yes gene_type:complete
MDRHEIYFREFVGWRKAKELMKSGGIKIDSARQLSEESKVPIYIIEKLLNNKGGTYNEKSWKALSKLNKWLIDNSDGAVCLRALGKYKDKDKDKKEKLAEVIPPLKTEDVSLPKIQNISLVKMDDELDEPSIYRLRAVSDNPNTNTNTNPFKESQDDSMAESLSCICESLNRKKEGLGDETLKQTQRLKLKPEASYIYALGVERGLFEGRDELLHTLTELMKGQ